MVTNLWSDMLLTSGEKAELMPVCGVGTAVQPQPPGTQVATWEVNCPKLPLSNPSAKVSPQGVTVGVDVSGVVVLVGVHVINGVCVTLGVAVPAPQSLINTDISFVFSFDTNISSRVSALNCPPITV